MKGIESIIVIDNKPKPPKGGFPDCAKDHSFVEVEITWKDGLQGKCFRALTEEEIKKYTEEEE